MVSQALAGATDALLSNDATLGLAVVEGDQAVDDLTAQVGADGVEATAR